MNGLEEILGIIAILWFVGWIFDRVIRWLDDRPSRPGS